MVQVVKLQLEPEDLGTNTVTILGVNLRVFPIENCSEHTLYGMLGDELDDEYAEAETEASTRAVVPDPDVVVGPSWIILSRGSPATPKCTEH